MQKFDTVIKGKNKDNRRIDVIDIVSLYFKDRTLFNRLFDESQKIYDYSFKEEEKEPRRTVRYEYIHWMAEDLKTGNDENYGDSRFFYLVPLINNQAVGMASSDFLPMEDSSIAFGGYLAVHKDFRKLGIGKMLVEGLIKSSYSESKEKKKQLKYSFGEIEKPDFSLDDELRNEKRPALCHKVAGFGAAATIKDNKVNLIPYAQPGIIKQQGIVPPSVPFLAGIAYVKEGELEKIAVEPGTVISEQGKLIGDKERIPSLDSNEAYKIFNAILMECYATGEIYDKKQIKGIMDEIEKTLDSTAKVHLVPIKDTAYLDLEIIYKA